MNANKLNNSIIIKSDSYKASHYLQYPPLSEGMFSYIESRIKDKELLFFGLQYILKEYFTKPIKRKDIKYAEALITSHGLPFNKKGWDYILKTYKGYLPLKIKAVKEGSIVPSQVPLVTVECEDPEVFWLVSYIETILLKVWYPITVATRSMEIKNIFKEYYEKTSDDSGGITFKLHDFGARGVSSDESAGIGGMAHLMNFMGTDTMVALMYAQSYYNHIGAAGYSISAAEHSTITSWQKENELYAYRSIIKRLLKPNGLLAIVADSYDMDNAVENYFGKELKMDIIKSCGTLVIRPDSGVPHEIVLKTALSLDKAFGSTINSKGFKVLNHVRIIQGDGVNKESIVKILNVLMENRFSIDNIAFGMGAELLQKVNRDTYNFAMKTSSIKLNGNWYDVYKAPITDLTKRSKKGRITTIVKEGIYQCIDLENIEEFKNNGWEDALELVFENGILIKDYNFNDIRNI